MKIKLILLTFLLILRAHAVKVVTSYEDDVGMIGAATVLAEDINSVAIQNDKIVDGKVLTVKVSFQLIHELRQLRDLTGERISEIHSFGHAQGPFDRYVYELDIGLLHQLVKEKIVSDDLKIVFHGCQLGHNSNLSTFAKKLPPKGVIYGHRLRSQNGQPFDWMKVYIDSSTGKVKKEYLAQWEVKNVIGRLFSEEYVNKWIELNKDRTSKNGNRAIRYFDRLLYQDRMNVKKGYLPDDIRPLIINN